MSATGNDGDVKGRHPDAIFGVDLRTTRDQIVAGLGMAIKRSDVQRCSAQCVLGIDVGATINQRLDLGNVALDGCFRER